MRAFSPGGSSLFPNDEIININVMNDVASIGGLGNFSNVDLEKVLAGKKASVSASVGGNTEGLSGSCSPKDFETLMQLVYLSFTAPRMDNDAFTSFKNRLQASLANQEANPMTALQDTLQKALYMGHPRTIRMKADMVDKIDYARSYGDVQRPFQRRQRLYFHLCRKHQTGRSRAVNCNLSGSFAFCQPQGNLP